MWRVIKTKPNTPENKITAIAVSGNQGDIRMWPSEDLASRLYDIANVGLIVGLIIGAVSTVMLVWMGNVKETYLKKELGATGERAARAIERATKAELDLAKLKAVRTLDAEQQQRMITKLAQFPGTPFVLSVNPDAESIDFMGIVAATLMAAKWVWEPAPKNVDRVGHLQAALWYRSGIAVTIRSANQTKLMLAADGLASALEAEGFKVETGLVPAMVAGNPNAVHVIVGSKPLN
jgi:hypothetical protein